jgi:hypothetical protein
MSGNDRSTDGDTVIPHQRGEGEFGGDPQHHESRLARAAHDAYGAGGDDSTGGGSGCLGTFLLLPLVLLLAWGAGGGHAGSRGDGGTARDGGDDTGWFPTRDTEPAHDCPSGHDSKGNCSDGSGYHLGSRGGWSEGGGGGDCLILIIGGVLTLAGLGGTAGIVFT